MTKTNRLTEVPMFIIKKISKICITVCLLISILLSINVSAFEQYLVTVLLIPDKSISYTDYDSAYITLINNKTGQSHHLTLYPYNNFSDKVLLDEGEYSVLDAGLVGYNDMIFEVSADDVIVDKSVSIVVNLKDSQIIQRTTTTTKKTTVTEPHPTETTKPEPSTLFPIISEHSDTEPVSEPSTSATKSYTQTNTTNNDTTTISEPEFHKPAVVIPVTVIIAATLIIIAFFIVLYKKNKADE